VFKIENRSDGRETILRLSGRIESKHVVELKSQIENGGRRIVLDLEEVKLVDRDVVKFLCLCESNGIELRNSAPYIREWMFRENVQREPR
jgi:anti-anti-sigma regulatory factor